MKVVFFGTSTFSVKVLEFLLSGGIDIVAIVTKPDKKKGRSQKVSAPPLKQAFLTSDIPIHQPLKASSPEFESVLAEYHADLFVVVAYGEIIRKNILDLPSIACVNIHASLLPRYRGASPIQSTLLNGDSVSGITIIEMNEKMDEGDILATAEVPVSEDATFDVLESDLQQLAGPLMLDVIKQFENKAITKSPQSHADATYVAKISKDDLKIDWQQDARKIHNQIRAFSPKPGAYTIVSIQGETKRMKILKSKVLSRAGLPGSTISYDESEWIVACGNESIQILDLQLEGKKMMPFIDFKKGHNIPPNFIN